jgi:hypothetical protein
MEVLFEFFDGFIAQLQKPVLAFLIAGMVVAAFNSKLRIPEAIYQFCVFILLMRIGLKGGMAIREANIMEMLLPAVFSIILGIGIVLLGSLTLARLPGIKKDDAFATLGLFGAVSGSTLAAGMMILEGEGIFYEAWVPALYPFMDIPALILAIVLANLYLSKQKGDNGTKVAIWPIIKDCLQGAALTALIVGLVLGLITKPERVFEGFYDPLFRGFLSVLMLIMGIEAYKRIKELAKVAHWYVAFAFAAPIVHGLMGFGLGYVAYRLVDLSPGGVILLAIIAASNSDISGPPTVRAGIPTANPSVYIGISTGLGTVVAIAVCIPLFLALGQMVFGF